MNNEELIGGIIDGTIRPGEIIDNFNHFVDTMSEAADSDATTPESVTRTMQNARINMDTVTMPLRGSTIAEIAQSGYRSVVDLREERIKQLEERMRIVEEENLKYANIMEEYKELKDIFARLRDFYQKTGLKLYDNI